MADSAHHPTNLPVTAFMKDQLDIGSVIGWKSSRQRHFLSRSRFSVFEIDAGFEAT
jgi:hypothetical protein